MDSEKVTKRAKRHITAYDVAMIGMMTALMVASKEALSFLANIELVSFWVIMFTVYFGWRIWFVILAFILIECSIYSLGIWNLMYFLVWPVLAAVAWIFRKVDSAWLWSIISGAFGLSYGFLCTIVYGVLAILNSGVQVGLTSAFAWWAAGIPYDIVHCIGNFTIMLVLYRPMRKVMHLVGEMRQSRRAE